MRRRELVGSSVGRLRVQRAESTGRRASWLELFFDLVFVVAVSRLAYVLHADPTGSGLLVFVGLFVPVWWAWISFSYYADLFGDETPMQRLAQLAAMFGAALLAVTVDKGVGEDSHVFAATYAALFVLLAALYEHARRTEPQARELCRWYVAGSLTGAAGWLLSLAVPTPARYLVWGVALILNAAVSGPIAYARVRSVPQQVSHMPERFGLFVIVVLGESLLAVVNGTIDTDWQPRAVLIGLLGFVTAAAVWWMYFSQFDERLIDRALQTGRRAQVVSFVYGYGHLLVYAAIAAAGVGIELAIEHAAEPALAPGERIVLAGSLAAYVVVLTAIQAAAGRRVPAVAVAVKAAAVLVLVAAALLPLPPLGTAALAAAVPVGLIVITATTYGRAALAHPGGDPSAAVDDSAGTGDRSPTASGRQAGVPTGQGNRHR